MLLFIKAKYIILKERTVGTTGTPKPLLKARYTKLLWEDCLQSLIPTTHFMPKYDLRIITHLKFNKSRRILPTPS
jgi:hypothetical protein